MNCNMERSCKGVAGGWMRIASFNITTGGSTCPWMKIVSLDMTTNGSICLPGLRTLQDPQPLCDGY